MKEQLLHFQNGLKTRVENGNIRILKSRNLDNDFSSNDYLSLNSDKDWLNYLKHNIPEEYWFQSLSSSRLVSGNSPLKESIEGFFSDFYNSESALFFNSGYTANISLFSSIPGKHDTVIYDSDIHASVRDGLKMSLCKSYKFNHNSKEDLDKKLSKVKGQAYVVVESVYSMDGEIAPLVDILETCEKYGALLIVDEAHSVGLFGKNGKGLCEELGISDRVFIRLMTFGKAIATHGAVVLSSEEVRQFLINFARPFIYSTSPSSFDFLKAQKSVQFIADNPNLIIDLQRNITLFNGLIHKNKMVESRVPIIPFYHSSVSKLKAFEHLGVENNYQFKTILPPTVSKGKECIRFSLQRLMKKKDLLKVDNLLKSHFELL